MMRIHIIRSTTRMPQRTFPPSSIKPRIAAKKLTNATMTALRDARDDAGRLRFQNLDPRAGAALQKAVQEGEGQADERTLHRREPRHRRTAGHQARVVR